MAVCLLTLPMAKDFISGNSVNPGVMVSPGRFVNLSGAPPSVEQMIRAGIDNAMRKARFTRHAMRCEEILVEALRDAWGYRLQPHHSYRGKKVTRLSFGGARPNDRDQEMIRMYLLARLWYCWMLGVGKKPTVNNRPNPDTPFVLFVKDVSPCFGLGNVVKNLERYQAYRKRNLI